MKQLIFTICLLLNLNVFAQKVKIQEDPIISNMMSKFAEFNKQKKTTTGWRIQIASTTDRRQMEETVKNFERNFPDVPLTWIHAKPYYQVRVGAYKNKIESLRLLNTVKVDYPTAYPVQDNTIKEADLAGVKN
jgi:hypothetical protein